MTLKYTIEASTPQQFKEAVVKWLNREAVEHRATARSAKTARYQKEHTDKAETLEYAAKFIYEIEIEDNKPLDTLEMLDRIKQLNP